MSGDELVKNFTRTARIEIVSKFATAILIFLNFLCANRAVAITSQMRADFD